MSLNPSFFYTAHSNFFILLFLFTFWYFVKLILVLFIQNILKLILQINFIIEIRFYLIIMVFKSLKISFFKLRAHFKRILNRHTVSSILMFIFSCNIGCYNLSWGVFVNIFWYLQLPVDKIQIFKIVCLLIKCLILLFSQWIVSLLLDCLRILLLLVPENWWQWRCWPIVCRK